MNNNFIFLKKWLKSPLKIGSMFPSSVNLTNSIVEIINKYFNNYEIIEIGPGTGAITDGLIHIRKQITIVEIDSEFVKLLKKKYESQKIKIINSCITEYNISTDKNILFVSSLPFKSLGKSETLKILNYFFSLKKDFCLLQYSYGFNEPVNLPYPYYWKKMDFVVSNMPPASIWLLTK